MMNEEHIAKLDGVNADIDFSQLVEMSKNNVIASRSNAITSSNLIEKANEHSLKISALEAGYNDLANRMDLREQNETISTKQRGNIRAAVNRRVRKILGLKKDGGKYTVESKKLRKVYGNLFYSKLYDAIEHRFDVGTYQDIRATDYDDAMAFIESWNYEGDGGNAELMRESEVNWSVNHPDIPVNEYLGRLSV